MRGFLQLTWVEIKLFLREPMATFFTLIFPLMLLFVFGSIFGNKPQAFIGGFGSVDVSVPAYASMIIATSGLLSLTITLASYREKGILRRLSVAPLRPEAILISQVTVFLLMTILGLLFLFIAAKVFYGLRFKGNFLSVLGAFVLSSMSFFSLGFLLASILPTARTAQIVSMALFYPMLFLSGAAIPRELLPESVRRVAQVLPLSHVVNLLRGLWIGESWGKKSTAVVVLAGILIVSVLVSAKTFRWE